MKHLKFPEIALICAPLGFAAIEFFYGFTDQWGSGVLSVYFAVLSLAIYVVYELVTLKNEYDPQISELNEKVSLVAQQTELHGEISDALLYVIKCDDSEFVLNALEEIEKMRSNMIGIKKGEIRFPLREKSGVWRSMGRAGESLKTVFFAENVDHFELWNRPNMKDYLELQDDWARNINKNITRIIIFDPNKYSEYTSDVTNIFDMISSHSVSLYVVAENVLLNNNSRIDYCDRVYVDDQHVFVHTRKTNFGNGYTDVVMVQNEAKVKKELAQFARWMRRAKSWSTDTGRTEVIDWLENGLKP